MKPNNHLYLITHLPSGLFYVGVHVNHAAIRFEEHMHGFGSIAIAEILKNGGDRHDFDLLILSAHETTSAARAAETKLIRELNTAWPNGLNTGNRISSWKIFIQKRKEYQERGWCVIGLENQVCFGHRPLTEMQSQIERMAKNQTSVKMIEADAMERLRATARRSYASRENFQTKDMSNFFAARAKEHDRMRAGNKTDAELIAASGRSKSMLVVWENRDAATKAQIIKTRSSAGGKARSKQVKL